jgi:ribosomal-protein-alanine N-acetyltransferase
MTTSFETSRTCLKRFTLKDQADLYALESLEQVMVFTGPGRAQNKDESLKRLKRFIDHKPRKEIIDFFKVISKANSEMIGFFAIFEHEGHSPELGYMLNPKFWGKGYAKEVASYLCDKAMSKFGIEVLIASCDTQNPRSIKVLEYCGFNEVRRELKHNKELGRDFDLIHFQLKSGT